ncbi:MAG TPA: CGNR zinc finger domain-containing protein [Actinomycetales bacterium]|nr:CGNR zinc finger domain-containing protein [Actinomycetales bacterium]
MLFSHDTECALQAAAALINTVSEAQGQDGITTVDELDTWLDEWEFSGSRDHNEAELAAVRDLRPRLRRIWTAGEDEAVDAVNLLLAQAGALPQLVRHDAWDYHLHATAPDAPVVTRLAVEAAMALVDVIRGRQMDRLGVCAAEDCDGVVIDLSKNRSRRYCEAGCGNRVHVAAYRARRALEQNLERRADTGQRR